MDTVTHTPDFNGESLPVILEGATDSQARSDERLLSAINMTGIVVYSLVTLFQGASSFRFYQQTRSLKEVGWMPHVINSLAMVTGSCMVIYYWEQYIGQTKSIMVSVSVVAVRLSNMVNYWFMIRLIRVQVQIMSQKELTKTIIK